MRVLGEMRPRRHRSGSARRCRARRRPNRDRRRARARRRAGSSPSAKSPRLPDGVKTTRWVKSHPWRRAPPPCSQSPPRPGNRATVERWRSSSAATRRRGPADMVEGRRSRSWPAEAARNPRLHAAPSRPSCLARTASRCVSYSASSRAAAAVSLRFEIVAARRRARRAASRRDRRRRSSRPHASRPRRWRG